MWLDTFMQVREDKHIEKIMLGMIFFILKLVRLILLLGISVWVGSISMSHWG